jgi:hypothetical protein
MPDLAQAAFAEEQKLARKNAERTAVGPISLSRWGLLYSMLSGGGVPVSAATVIANEIDKLNARVEELEKAAGPPHTRKQERRNG